MSDKCPHLTYQRERDGEAFETPRAYCEVVETFVQPMRADICNSRYGLDPETDCEHYVDPERMGVDDGPDPNGSGVGDGSDSGGGGS